MREEFLPKYCNWSERTLKGEESRIRILCEQFGPLPLSGLTSSTIKSWLAKRGAEGRSPASQNRYLAALNNPIPTEQLPGDSCERIYSPFSTER